MSPGDCACRGGARNNAELAPAAKCQFLFYKNHVLSRADCLNSKRQQRLVGVNMRNIGGNIGEVSRGQWPDVSTLALLPGNDIYCLEMHKINDHFCAAAGRSYHPISEPVCSVTAAAGDTGQW